MPFIRGRYYVNPIAGQALEDARDAEEALLASRGPDGNDGATEEDQRSGSADKGPIHRIEIETAELVPSHAGKVEKGYVTRIHRHSIAETAAAKGEQYGEAHVFYDKAKLLNFLSDQFAKDERRDQSARG